MLMYSKGDYKPKRRKIAGATPTSIKADKISSDEKRMIHALHTKWREFAYILFVLLCVKRVDCSGLIYLAQESIRNEGCRKNALRPYAVRSVQLSRVRVRRAFTLRPRVYIEMLKCPALPIVN